MGDAGSCHSIMDSWVLRDKCESVEVLGGGETVGGIGIGGGRVGMRVQVVLDFWMSSLTDPRLHEIPF